MIFYAIYFVRYSVSTPLHLAAEQGQWDVVKWLVDEKGADVKATDNDGRTVLHFTAERGKWDVVEWL